MGVNSALELEVEEVKEKIDDEVVYRHSLQRLQERVEDMSSVYRSIELTHLLHEILLTQRFIRYVFRDDLESKITNRLVGGGEEDIQDSLKQRTMEEAVEHSDSIEDNEQNDEPTVRDRMLSRVVRKIDLEQVIDYDYGLVQQSILTGAIASEMSMDRDDESSVELLDRLSQALTYIIQEELEELDVQYREDRIKPIFNTLTTICNNEEEDNLEAIRKFFANEKIRLHHEHFDWPGYIEVNYGG